MSRFKPLEQINLPTTLELPIGGTTYVVQPVDCATGMWAQTLLRDAARAIAEGGETTDATTLDDDGERDAFARVLGSTLDEMIADGVSWEQIKYAGTTALMWVGMDREAAWRFWHQGVYAPAFAPHNTADSR